MPDLPLDQSVLDVQISAATQLPTVEGFGTILIMSHDAGNALDGTNRTKLYANIQEVLEDFDILSEVYSAAVTAFSQNPSPTSIKVGYVENGETLVEAIAAIDAYDCDFYGIVLDASMRDNSELLELAEWVAANTKMLGICTNDPTIEQQGSVGHISLQLAGISNVWGFYHTDETQYPEVALMARILSHDFNTSNSYYTAKFKSLNNITPINKSTAAIRSITGFVPGQGLNPDEGFLTNTYIQMGGVSIVIEGQTYTGEFIDQVHFRHWLVSAIQNAVFVEKKKADYIPYTDAGIAQIGAAIKRALDVGVRSGGIGSPGLDDDDNIIPAYNITLPRRNDIQEALRAQRILPGITFTAKQSGAIHYTTIKGTIEV